MNITRVCFISAAALAVSTVVGCSAILQDPIYDSVMRSVKSENLKDEVKSYQIGWLGQALLEPQARNNVAKKLVENAPQISTERMSAADVSLAAQMATDVAFGQLGSGMGDAVGAAFFVGAAALSLLAGDGSLNTTSVVLLPAELDGKALDSKEQAKAAAEQLIVKSYQLAANKFGYSFQCEYSCEGFPSVYRMLRTPEAVTSAFIYAADDVAIYFEDFEVIAPENTQALDSLATGFMVAWRSNFNNDAAAYLMQNPQLDANGKVLITPTDKMPSGWSITGDNRFFRTDFGRSMLREVYDNPFMIFGTANSYPQVAYYNGVVYRYTLNSVPKAFDKTVLPF
uniref:hypothetical protein n=1 Tax=Rheinheimera sp. TaxID=1869214 RepID=UPI0040478624